MAFALSCSSGTFRRRGPRLTAFNRSSRDIWLSGRTANFEKTKLLGIETSRRTEPARKTRRMKSGAECAGATDRGAHRATLSDALHLISDVPVALFLSGGVDSAAWARWRSEPERTAHGVDDRIRRSLRSTSPRRAAAPPSYSAFRIAFCVSRRARRTIRSTTPSGRWISRRWTD